MGPKRLIALCSILVVTAALSAPGNLQARSAVKIENVELIPRGESQLGGGVRFEDNRVAAEMGNTELEYDNTRFRVIDYRMGVLDNFELQLGLNHSNNSAATAGAPDQSGIEGIRLGGKIQWHPNISTSLSAKFSGADNVHPMGHDDPSIGANVPIKFQLGDGTFHGELGFTFQSGNAFAAGNQVGDWDNFFNYGVGYTYDYNHFTDMSAEVVGHTPTVESNALSFEDHLELIFGAGMRVGRGVRLKPSAGFALMDGSPDFSLGVDYEIDFGSRKLPEPEDEKGPEPEKRFSTREPIGGAKDDSSEESMTQQDAESSETTMKPTEQSRSQNVQSLMDRGYEASQEGDLDRAIRLYEQAEAMSPNNLLAQSNLGSLHYRKGNYRKAIEHYRKAVKTNPEDTFSLLYLGASHYRLGNRQAAREYFERVRDIDPGNERAQQWLDRLKN